MEPIAILTADWHLREDTPTCRTDDFWKAQWNKVGQIKSLAEKHNCKIIHAGDLFHHWKPSPLLLSWCIDIIPIMYVLPGNHDLPNHNLDLLGRSGLWTLHSANKIITVLGDLGKITELTLYGELKENKIGLTHQLINHPHSDETARKLLEKNDYDLIVSGDNHTSFTDSFDGKLLVNPGSLTRQSADQVNHQPSIYLLYENGDVKREYLEIEEGVISREHLEMKKEKDERIEAFVNQLNNDYDLELSFEKNLEKYFQANRNRKSIEDMVWESIDG